MSPLRGLVNALGTAALAFGLITGLHALIAGSWDGWGYAIVLVAYLLWLPEGYARNAAGEKSPAPMPPRALTVAAWGYAAAVVVALAVVLAVDADAFGRAAMLAWAPVVGGLLVATAVAWISGGRGFFRNLRRRYSRETT